jgi:hypothetical protein
MILKETRLWKDKIRHHSYEGDCGRCGYPLDVGDTATYTEDDRMFCSSACALEELRLEKARPWPPSAG